jgi:hypothetical protein
MIMQLLEVAMMVLRLSALILVAGLPMQPQTVPAPAVNPTPLTGVMVMTSRKPAQALPDVMKLVQEEVRVAVQLYLDGKIDRWYTRSDGNGAVLFLNCKTVDEAKEIVSALPMVKAGYLDVEYVPVGPFSGLRALIGPSLH